MFEKLRETMIEEGKKTRESFDQFKAEMLQRNKVYEQEISNLKSKITMLDKPPPPNRRPPHIRRPPKLEGHAWKKVHRPY